MVKHNPVDKLIKKYAKLFEGGMGFKATIALQPGTKPIYRKARPVPYEVELDRLEQQHSDCTSHCGFAETIK